MTQLKTSIKDITKAIIDPVCGMNVPSVRQIFLLISGGAITTSAQRPAAKPLKKTHKSIWKPRPTKAKDGGDAI